MYRTAMELLRQWKRAGDRKPLIIEGARQVGKTWLAKEFAARFYTDYVYINFNDNPQISSLFSGNLNVERLIMGLEIYAGRKLEPGTTLLIFDEIQEVPGALKSLPAFAEKAPRQHMICICSGLKSALHNGTYFPADKVDFLQLNPLSFREFLQAAGHNELLEPLDLGAFITVASLKDAYIDALRQYFYVGGMPEAVLSFAAEKDFNKVRGIHAKILGAYGLELSRSAPNELVPRIRMVLNSIPEQLSKENKKFFYNQVREGARAKDFEAAIQWLTDNGLVHKVSRTGAGERSIKSSEDKAFKLFLVDVGLLGCMVGLRQRALLDGNAVFTGFQGAMLHQYAAQQLLSVPGLEVRYYTNSRGSGEVDFVVIHRGEMIPVEVAPEINLQAKSLKTYREKFYPEISVRMSLADYRQENGLVDLPLYAAEKIPLRLEK